MYIELWEVPNAFLAIVQPFIPKRKRDKSKTCKRTIGGGRKPIEQRIRYENLP